MLSVDRRRALWDSGRRERGGRARPHGARAPGVFSRTRTSPRPRSCARVDGHEGEPVTITADLVQQFSFTSNQSAGHGFRSVATAPTDAPDAVAAAMGISRTRGLRLARGILLTSPDVETGESEARSMLEWAGQAGSDERRLVCEAMRLSGGGLLVVDHLARLPRTEGRPYLADHFAAGGGVREIAEWLGLAGRFLREHRPTDPDHAGFIGTVGNWISDTWDSVTEAVSNVVDAFLELGKSVAELVAEVANWTVEQLADLVEALIDAGTSAAELLAGAVQQGFAQLGRWVEALIEAGRSVGEVLSWAVTQAAATVRETVRALRTAIGRVRELLEWAAGQAANVVRQVVGAARDIGVAVRTLLEDAIAAAANVVRATVEALLAIGEQLRDVLAAIGTFAAAQARAVVAALREIGRTVGQILTAAWEATRTALRRTVAALREIAGHVGEIMLAVRNAARNVLTDVLDAVVWAAGSLVEVATWLVSQTATVVRRVVEAALDGARTLKSLIEDAINAAAQAIRIVTQALLDIGRTMAQLLQAVWNSPGSFFRELAAALRGIAGTLGGMLGELAGVGATLFRRTVRALVELGENLRDLASWAVSQAASIARDVIRAIVDAGTRIVDLVASVVGHGLELMRTVIDGLFAIGRTFTSLIRDLIDIAVDALGEVLTAMFELGVTLAQIAGEALARTYALAGKLIDAALRAGATVAGLLAEIAGQGYFVLRRFVTGVFGALGTVGEVLEWVLERAEQFAEDLWRDALLALRFAGAQLTAALDWVVDKGSEAIKAMVDAWESIRERLVDLYEWGASLVGDAVDAVWEAIGRATIKFQNSISYALIYLQTNFVPGVAAFVTGLLGFGAELAVLISNLAARTYEVIEAAVSAMLEFGIIAGELFVATLLRPQDFRDHVVAAMQAAGQTLEDLLRAVEEYGEDVIDELLRSAARLGESVDQMLDAALTIGLGYLVIVISTLLSWLSTFRPLTEEERAAGQVVFGDTLDYDHIHVTAESPTNWIIFGIQGWFEDSPRPFVTMNVINVDPSSPPSTATMVHEMTHVWQSLVDGPIYMTDAIHAQMQEGQMAYNYGYTNGTNGEGGQQALRDADGDLSQFNPEQQGNIAEHAWVRWTAVNTGPEEEREDPGFLEPWDDYIAVFQAA